MGLKLGGFVCDNCSTFSQYRGVKSETDVLDLMEKTNIEDVDIEKISHAFARLPGWHYYDVIDVDDVWFIWVSHKSICLCQDCDRITKINRIRKKLNKK